MQQQVCDIPFGVDHQRRDAVQRRFFQHADAQTGLAGAGHTDHEGMCGQVSWIVEQGLVAGFALGWVKNTSHVELAVSVHILVYPPI